jgi:DNA-binding GntR family transcriptional regulator
MYDELELEVTSTVDQVAETVRRAMFAGDLPPGSPLREVALSEQLNVSRGTIREALGLLVAEGIAVRVPNRGVAVKELSADDVRDVSRARAALESAGVRRWRTATGEQRQQVKDALDAYARLASRTSDSAALTQAHLLIHRALVGLTGSERLLAAADAWSAEIRLGLAQLDRTRRNIQAQVADHRHLVGMLERGEVLDAVAELDRHLAAAEVSLLEATGHGTIDA